MMIWYSKKVHWLRLWYDQSCMIFTLSGGKFTGLVIVKSHIKVVSNDPSNK